MKGRATSKNGVSIRLTAERWEHIIHPEEGHPEVSRLHQEIFQVVADPEAVYEGEEGELIAIKKNSTREVPCGHLQRNQLCRWIYHHCMADE